MVNFQASYGEYAASIHKNAMALTEQEKAESRLQAVLNAGKGIYGTYGASQLTAAGQMQSLARYTDELKNKFGEGLQPVLYTIIGAMRTLTSVAGENVDKFQHLTAGAAALAAGGTLFAATSFIPSMPVRAGIAALGAGAAYLATDKDPAQTTIDVTKDQLEHLDALRRGGGMTPDTAKMASDRVLAEARYLLAKAYQQRQARGEFITDTSKFTSSDWTAMGRAGLTPDAYGRAKGFTTGSAYPARIDLGNGHVITGEQLKHEFDADPNGSLKPAPLDDDDAVKAFQDAIKETAKSLRSQVNSSALQLLSGTARIDAQAANMRTDLGTALQGFSAKQLASPEVGQLYGYITKIGQQETEKYNRDRILKSIDYNADLALATRGIDGRKKQPGDLSDATAEYRSSIDTAGRKWIINKNWDEYQDSMNAAQVRMARARRSSAEAIDSSDIDTQVSGIKDQASLQLRLLNVGKTDQNAGSIIGQEYQIRVQASAKEFAATGDLKTERKEIADAWADKMVATAEHENQLVQKQKADRIAIIQSESQFRSKMSALTVGPHDQFSAIRNAYKEALDSALQIYAVDQKADELKKRTLDAEHEMELSIAQLRIQGLQQYEDVAGKVFHAILAKNGKRGQDFRQLLLSEAEGVGRKMFTNAAGLTFGSYQNLGVGNLIPGQYEQNPDGTPKIDPKTGNPTLTTVGKIMQGTPLGTNQAKLASAGIEKSVHSTDFNTTAIKALTAAIERILGLRAGGLSAGVHSIGGNFGGFGGGANTNSVIFGGGSMPISNPGSSTSIFMPMMGGDGNPEGGYSPIGTSSSTFTPMTLPGYLGGGGAPEATMDVLPGGALANTAAAPYSSLSYEGSSYPITAGVDALPPGQLSNTNLAPYTFSGAKSGGSIAGPLFDPNASASQMATSAMASAGAAYAGTMGVIGGIKKGGAYGAISAIGSAAGTAAAFDPEPISKAILAGVALGSGVITAIMGDPGDPRANFAKQQTQDLQQNHWFGPNQLNVSSDSNGNLVSQGFKGNVGSTNYSAFALTNTPGSFQNNNGTWDAVPGQVTQQYSAKPSLTLNADFVDPAGLQARASDIADAVQTAMLRGHPITDTVNQIGK